MAMATRSWWFNKWVQPVLALVLGVVMWVAFWLGGDPAAGLLSFGIMAAFGALLLLGGRSEMVRGMRGDGRDERWAMIDLRATALAGLVIITAVIVAFLVEIAHGHDGMPYAWLGALGGVAYVVGLLIGRWRS